MTFDEWWSQQELNWDTSRLALARVVWDACLSCTLLGDFVTNEKRKATEAERGRILDILWSEYAATAGAPECRAYYENTDRRIRALEGE